MAARWLRSSVGPAHDVRIAGTPVNAPAVSRVLRAAGLGVVSGYSREGLRVSRGVNGTVFVVEQVDIVSDAWVGAAYGRATREARTALEAAGYLVCTVDETLLRVDGKRPALVGRQVEVKPGADFYVGHWGVIIDVDGDRYTVSGGSIGSTVAPIFSRDELRLLRRAK